MARLEGKVALISGGAKGQGATEARMFAREGAKIVIGDLLDTEGHAVAAEIAEAGGDCVYVHLDVTSEDDWRKAVETAVSEYGKVDVLVNNAGIIESGRVEEVTVEQWDAVLDVNAKGVFLGTKAVIAEMRKAGGGSIINISSTSGIVGSVNTTAYNASKGAVRLLTKSTALQYGKEGIRANSIHPGPIDTDMMQRVWQHPLRSREETEARIPLGHVGEVEDVSYAALFLASDESKFMTGSEMVIDGGMTAA